MYGGKHSCHAEQDNGSTRYTDTKAYYTQYATVGCSLLSSFDRITASRYRQPFPSTDRSIGTSWQFVNDKKEKIKKKNVQTSAVGGVAQLDVAKVFNGAAVGNLSATFNWLRRGGHLGGVACPCSGKWGRGVVERCVGFPHQRCGKAAAFNDDDVGEKTS